MSLKRSEDQTYVVTITSNRMDVKGFKAGDEFFNNIIGNPNIYYYHVDELENVHLFLPPIYNDEYLLSSQLTQDKTITIYGLNPDRAFPIAAMKSFKQIYLELTPNHPDPYSLVCDDHIELMERMDPGSLRLQFSDGRQVILSHFFSNDVNDQHQVRNLLINGIHHRITNTHEIAQSLQNCSVNLSAPDLQSLLELPYSQNVKISILQDLDDCINEYNRLKDVLPRFDDLLFNALKTVDSISTRNVQELGPRLFFSIHHDQSYFYNISEKTYDEAALIRDKRHIDDVNQGQVLSSAAGRNSFFIADAVHYFKYLLTPWYAFNKLKLYSILPFNFFSKNRLIDLSGENNKAEGALTVSLVNSQPSVPSIVRSRFNHFERGISRRHSASQDNNFHFINDLINPSRHFIHANNSLSILLINTLYQTSEACINMQIAQLKEDYLRESRYLAALEESASTSYKDFSERLAAQNF